MEILVVILSVFLALFLLLGIIATILCIKLTKSINRVVQKAEDAVGNIEHATNMFKNVAGPLATGKFLMNIADYFMNNMNKRKGKG